MLCELANVCAYIICWGSLSPEVQHSPQVTCPVSEFPPTPSLVPRGGGGVASYPGHVGGGKRGLVSTVCACAKNSMISWGIVYHRLRTINLYRSTSVSSLSRARQVKGEDFDKALKFGLCCIGKVDFTLKAE